MKSTAEMTAEEIVQKVRSGEIPSTTYNSVEDFLKTMGE